MRPGPEHISIIITILVGCPAHRAALLFHITQCDRCRLEFQQAIDHLMNDTPPELRPHITSFLRSRLEDEEVVKLQAEMQAEMEEHLSHPENRPN